MAETNPFLLLDQQQEENPFLKLDRTDASALPTGSIYPWTDEMQAKAAKDMPLTGIGGAIKPTFKQEMQGGPVGEVLHSALQGAAGLPQFLTNIAAKYTGNPTLQAYAQRGNEAMAEDERKQEVARKIAGATPLGTGIGVTGGRMIGGAPLAALTGGESIPMQVASGVVQGATQPVTNTDTPYAEQALSNAKTGLTLSAVPGIARAALSPKYSPEAQLLLREGVPLTPGQLIGGIAKRAEDTATSIPVTGDMIQSARQSGLEGLNRAVMNRALAPIGESLPKDQPLGREGVAYVSDRLSDAYNQVLPHLFGQLDQRFGADINGIMQRARMSMPEQQAERLRTILNGQILDKTQATNGAFSGQTIKGIESELNTASKGYASDPSYDNRQLGAYLDEARGAIRDMLMRTNPLQADRLKAINAGYANYAILRKAASNVGTATEGGTFTPGQLSAAVRAKDTSVDKGNFAKRAGLMQDLSDAASKTLPSKIPDSGTARRLLMDGAALYGGHMLNPLVPAGMIGGALAYTQPAQSAIRGLMTMRPDQLKALGDLIGQNPSYFLSGAIPASQEAGIQSR